MGDLPRDKEAVTIEVCAHKLFAPSAPPRAVVRTALLARLLGQDRPRIALLQGPAGHGKTTLLQQIKQACDDHDMVTGWLTLDDADNDPRRLFRHMEMLVGEVVGDEMQEAPAVRWRRRSDWIIDCLLQAPQPVALFIDELQTITSRALHLFFRELLERVPERVHLFIGSRSVPDVGLSRLVVNQQAQILHADDLRFSVDEVRAFFGHTGEQAISDQELDVIFRRTEGWPAALQLFRLSLASPQVRRDLADLAAYRPRELAEYLTDNVLGLQDPELQTFLLQTSLLTRLCAPLCEAVTGRADAQDLLLRVARSGLFLRNLDIDGRWFKYHGLFASFLADQFETLSPGMAKEVHRRAAAWHAEHARPDDAMHHALAAGDLEQAADLLEHWSPQLIADAQLITMERWLDRLPFEQVVARPSLVVKAAYALTFLHRRARLKPFIEALEGFHRDGVVNASVVLSMAAISGDDLADAFARVEQIDLAVEDAEGFDAFELGAAGNLAAYRHLSMGAFESARQCLSVARMYSQRGAASFSSGYNVGVTGMAMLLQGELQQALERFRVAQTEPWVRSDASQASASLVACQLWALYEANDLDAAEALYGQHREMIVESTLPDFLAIAQLAAVRVFDARGRVTRALEVLDEAEGLARANGWPRLLQLFAWERVRRALIAGQLEHARAIAELAPVDPEPPAWLTIAADACDDRLGAIRLAIHSGQIADAQQWLSTALEIQPGRIYRQIRLYLLEALLHRRREAHNAAQRSLQRALQLAAPGGFIRCFLDEGPGLMELLRQACQALLEQPGEGGGVSRDYVERLLRASGTDLGGARRAVIEAPLEPLTDREKEILILLGNGVSNKAMAKRIFVSENTVKFHLKNIYAKLAVGSRLQAITAARSLGLIE